MQAEMDVSSQQAMLRVLGRKAPTLCGNVTRPDTRLLGV